MIFHQSNSSFLIRSSLVLIGLALSGCEDNVKIANQQMEAIREADALPIEPPPNPELIEDYAYSADNKRSPFMPPSLLNWQRQTKNTVGVKPDVNRKKDPLESFELTQLTYRGMLISPEGQQFALVQRPDGLIDNVTVGEYMGTNDGRIVEITSTQINLIEITPDTRAGFVEKPNSLISP